MNDKELARDVGAVIAARRKAKGLTQAQVAETLAIEKETMSRIETGVISPTLPRLRQLSEILNCPIGDLFRLPSDDMEKQAALIAEMMVDLPAPERALLVEFVADVVKLFRAKNLA